MNKAQLIASIAESAGTTKVAAEKALNGVLEKMTEVMIQGDSVSLLGFGSFRVVERVVKKGRNPQTGESLIIPAHNVVKFKPGKTLCGRVQ